MARREYPDIGADLLTAVTAALAVVKAHLSDPDPKVALRAVAELTKLLTVCARHGIQLEAGPSAETSPPGPLSVPERGCSTRQSSGQTASVPEDAHVTHGGDPALNTPSPFMERGPGGEVLSSQPTRPPVHHKPQLASHRAQELPAGGSPKLASFLGSSPPSAAPPRAARVGPTPVSR